MAPTLHDGDVVLAVPGLRPADGAVALVRWPQRPEQLSVKRLALRLPDGGGDDADARTLGPAVAIAVVTHRLWPSPGRLPRR
jgi:hypothetical protein